NLEAAIAAQGQGGGGASRGGALGQGRRSRVPAGARERWRRPRATAARLPRADRSLHLGIRYRPIRPLRDLWSRYRAAFDGTPTVAGKLSGARGPLGFLRTSTSR